MQDLRRLRAFHAVAEQRSFSAAALELGYAQSVVSHHVGALERELGLTLIDRASRPVGLTDAGRRLHGHAVAVLGAVAAAQDELRALAGLRSGTLRVGAFLTACTGFVGPALARFVAAHPGVDVHVEQVEPEEALPRLRAGDLDVVVTWTFYHATLPPEGVDEAGIERRLLAHDRFRLALPADHRLARRRRLTLDDLADEAFTAPVEAPGGPYRAMLDRLCADAGFTPRIAYGVTDVTVARAFIAAGLCVGLLPELALPHPRPDVAVHPIAGIAPFRSIHAAWMAGRKVPAVAPMVDLLAEAAAAVMRG
jgi:DNA-binding transcriptional LysR family regulator